MIFKKYRLVECCGIYHVEVRKWFRWYGILRVASPEGESYELYKSLYDIHYKREAALEALNKYKYLKNHHNVNYEYIE